VGRDGGDAAGSGGSARATTAVKSTAATLMQALGARRNTRFIENFSIA